jgi:hypothetical protein
MTEIKEISNFVSIIFFVCPGLVFLYISSILSEGQSPPVNKETIVGFIALSVIYAVVAISFNLFPSNLLSSNLDIKDIKSLRESWILSYAIVIPFILGLVWGILVRGEISFKFARLVSLNPFHPRATAWATVFSRLKGGEFFIVTLKDGTTLRGYYEARSSISRDPTFRDIYLEETLPPEGQLPEVIRGTWIAPTEVRLIEVVSNRPGGQPIPNLKSGDDDE